MIKNLIPVLSFLVFIGCSSTKELSNNKYSWIQLLDDEAYLQISPKENAITEKVVSFGSIVYAYKTESEYLTVYLKKPKKSATTIKYYLYKPKYKRIKPNRYLKPKLNEIPFTLARKYIIGERSGCYYINSKSRKIYVERSVCTFLYEDLETPKQTISKPQKEQGLKQTITNYKTYKPTPSKSVQCSGRTKKGARCRNKTKNFSGRCHLH